MSEFSDKIYAVVCNIPEGYVMNYAMVAELAGYPSRTRQVGKVLHQNPDPSVIPCHRVVMKDGSLTEAFAFGGAGEQKARLQAEGVLFKGDKVDMEKHLVHIEHFIK